MTLDNMAELDVCFITTTGRVTKRPHVIEIWFGLSGQTVYLLSGGGDSSDWVKNVQQSPRVRVRLGDAEYAGTARIVEGGEEDGLARKLLLDKYGPRYGGDLTSWGRTALPVAIDLKVGGS